MALTGLKINELDNASVVTNETVLPVVYVNNGSASDTATKATLEQVKELVQEDNYTKTETDTLLNKKQDKLTAGDNITITEDSDENYVISASGGSLTEEMNTISATSGTIALESNKVYKASLDGSTTFTLPSTVDNTIFNQIYLQLDVTGTPTIDFGTTNYMTIEPVITSGINLICYEYNSNEQAWYIGKVGESDGGGGTGADTSLSNLTDAGKSIITQASAGSTSHDDLTLAASGTEYTAPSNGYFVIDCPTTGTQCNVWAGGVDGEWFDGIYAYGGGVQYTTPLCIKGHKYKIWYASTLNTSSLVLFRFVYAEGTKSDHV